MDPPRWLLSILFRPGRMLWVCIILVFASVWLMMHVERHNPNSHFFDPTPETFDGPYSTARKAQARAWIDLQDVNLQSGNAANVALFNQNAAAPDLSVVFVASRRPKEQYLDAALGSFLLELSREQRQRMHITVSLAEEDPLHQPFFASAWLHGLADQVSVRTQPSAPYLPAAMSAHKEQPTARLNVLPRPITTLANKQINTNAWHQRSTVDYSIALELCLQHTAPHCMVVEDDVVFATRWYDRLEPLLRKADGRYNGEGGSSRWGYIRLFYAEKYFGWENEEVRMLVVSCASTVAVVALLLIVLGRFPARYAAIAGATATRARPDLLHSHRDDYDSYERKVSYTRTGSLTTGGKQSIARVRLPLGSQLIILLMTLFFCVLFILSGRNHVYKVPDGVSEMNTRGCCTQAIVYTADVIKPIMEHLRQYVGVRPYDILVNRWILWNHFVKLVVHPPLVQHIGVGSTHAMVDETYLRSTPLWSFAFEKVTSKMQSLVVSAAGGS